MFAVFVLYRSDVVLRGGADVVVEIGLNGERVTLDLFNLIVKLLADLLLTILESLFGSETELNE